MDKVNKINTDEVNHPPHYTAGGVECIDAIAAATTGLEGIEAVYVANVVKYVWRWKMKGGLTDLEKAKWYLDRLITHVVKEKTKEKGKASNNEK